MISDRFSLRCFGLVLAVAVGPAAGSLSFGAETAAPAKAETIAATESGDTSMDEVNTKEVKITAADAKKHSLPAAEITINLGETGLSGFKFANEGEYLSLSGPPGGPLGMTVFHTKHLPKTDADWRKLVEERYDERATAMGEAADIEVAGGKHNAFSCTTDGGPAQAHHLLIAFAVPDSDEAIVVDFYSAGQGATPSPKTLLAAKKFSEISPSLSIRFE